jgi:ribonuclease G
MEEQSKIMLLNAESKEIRCALMKNGILEDLLVERKRERRLTGNIYRGRVTNILKNIQSAFIDINENENGFIHISDILENTRKFEQMFDLDFELDEPPISSRKELDSSTDRSKDQDIGQLLKHDQPVLVQVVKEPIGNKGARLTSNISLAGRYLVFLPNTPHRGVSRKIEDKAQRYRLRKLLKTLELPGSMGVICRTASQNATTQMLIDELNELLSTWHMIVDKFNNADGVECLYQETDLVKKAVMTCIDKHFNKLIVDDPAVHQFCCNLHHKFANEFPLQIELYKDRLPLFEKYHIDREIERALRRKIWLPSGGYLFFEKTEAMCTIDVNSGRSNGEETTSVEEALVRINLEAAIEIARLLRLRNEGGLIICDFIDMRSKKNQRRVLEKLKEAMKDDSAKWTILGMSEFGLVEMTRQRSRESLLQTMYHACPYCIGTGLIKTHETMAIEIERALKRVMQVHRETRFRLMIHPELEQHLVEEDRYYFRELARRMDCYLEFGTDDRLHLNDYAFISLSTGKRLAN